MRINFVAASTGLRAYPTSPGSDGMGVALSGDSVALAVGRTVQVLRLGTDSTKRVELPWDVDRIELSPSEQYLGAVSRESECGKVFDLASGETVLSIGEGRNLRRTLQLGFMADRFGFEHAVFCRGASNLEAVALPTGEPILRCFNDKRLFFLTRPVPMADGDSIALVGWPRGDNDMLLLVSLQELRDDPDGALPFLSLTRLSRSVYDDAYRIAAGPAGTDCMVLHRVPQYSESPDEDHMEELGRDCDRLRGFHIRRLRDRVLLEVVPCDVPVQTGAALFATDHAVVAAVPDGVLLVGRRGDLAGEVLDRVDAVATALDPAGQRAVILRSDGEVAVLRVEVRA